jgi:hypothetical protein
LVWFVKRESNQYLAQSFRLCIVWDIKRG